LTTLAPRHDAFKVCVPLKIFLSDSTDKSFRTLQAGVDRITIETRTKQFIDLVCYTKNAEQ